MRAPSRKEEERIPPGQKEGRAHALSAVRNENPSLVLFESSLHPTPEEKREMNKKESASSDVQKAWQKRSPSTEGALLLPTGASLKDSPQRRQRRSPLRGRPPEAASASKTAPNGRRTKTRATNEHRIRMARGVLTRGRGSKKRGRGHFGEDEREEALSGKVLP